MIQVQVPFFDLKLQLQAIQGEIEAAVHEVITSGHYILGPQVEELESQVAEYCGWKYALGMSSGTDALLASLMALDIGPGSLVLTTPFSFFATAGVIVRLGAIPVFVDIEPETFTVSPRALEKALRAIQECDLKSHPLPALLTRPTLSCQPKLILPVHLYGRQADRVSINRLASEFNLPVVEDGAQAIGRGRPGADGQGNNRNLFCLSFFPTKNLGALGDAGMVLTDDPALYEKLLLLRVHGAKTKYVHPLVGGNFRLDALQAAVLLVKLRHLDKWTKARRENAAYYRTLFERTDLIKQGLIAVPQWSSGVERPGDPTHVFNQYVIRAQDRDALRDYLAARGIGTEIYYPLPLHLQPCFKDLGYKEGDFPVTEKAAREVLALPIFPELTRDQQEYLVEGIHHFYQRRTF